VIERGLSEASASTIWRWLHDDPLKPWQQRSWVFVRDRRFAEKASPVLDLYQRRFEGRRLRPEEYVICADEKTQLQALGRRHSTLPPAPSQACRVEFEYERNGTLAYLAGWDVHHANLFDRVEAKTGIEPFGPARRAGMIIDSIVQRKALTPTTSTPLRRSPSGYSASATATGKSSGRSTGQSPAQTSTVS
jgi:hypothetical protein